MLYRQRTSHNLSFLIAVIVVAVLLLTSTMATASSGQLGIEVKINEKPAVFTNAHPYIDINHRTMVPVRFISENLGAAVDWDAPTRTVTVTKEDTRIKLQIDSDLLNVNGVDKQMDTRMVFNEKVSRNYVPLRFVSESLGAEIAVDYRERGTVLHISITDHLSSSIPAPPITKSDAGIYGISLGDSAEFVLDVLGNPARKDLSAYGYTWWVYNQNYAEYLQVGLKDGKVVNIYSNSLNWEYKGLKTGLSSNKAKNLFPYEPSLELEHGGATYTISQREEQPVGKYLAFEGDDTALQIYMDIHDDNKVTAIRLSDPAFILASSSYSMRISYLGELPEHKAATLTEAGQKAVDRANTNQLFDLVNAIRVRMNLHPLDWHQEIAEVAYGHSVDMQENNFFSHTSPSAGSFDERIKRAAISYAMIAENIAQGQADAIEAHEGLMNSYGHRVNILSPELRALGTGAYHKHYTQKFINPR